MEQDLKQEPNAEASEQAVPETEETVETQAEQAEQASAAPEDDRFEELKRQTEEAYQRQLRVQADFDNYRRRTLKETADLQKYASLKLVTNLLPVLDNFGRALQTSSEGAESDSFVKGIDMINRQLWQVLEAEGLKAMEPVGQPFDPELHQAIMTVESEEYEEGIVVEVVQPGYWLSDKVIRPAMVKVSG
ncbi:nucleotide exchange factor GrpE [Cohnella hashimotonis]|uniref:Protein GrpE n=1 Tax=Cohnella hashimotonis TaxID=2826895 RepID=A0ABT6TK29_9BACL|nr:nucleotide exchange factor GrpE [Cohnella hashimotonis]MDI4646645.1 nucleotide exchange factor GrpE [Cohnella hashimotonis]